MLKRLVSVILLSGIAAGSIRAADKLPAQNFRHSLQFPDGRHYYECGTYPELEQDLYNKSLLYQTLKVARLPTTQTRDVGNIAIVEDDGSFIFESADGYDIWDNQVAAKFYATHPDSFDFLVMYRNFDAGMFGFAYHSLVKNTTSGIGLSFFNNTAAYGSAGRLQGFTNSNDINYMVDDPHYHMYRIHSVLSGMLHETMHQWAAFLNNPNQLVNSSHWYTFSHTKSTYGDSTSSAMEGYIWKDNGGGDYQGYAFGDGLYPLDMYVMGLYDASQVPPIWYLQSPTITSPIGPFIPPYYALPIELHATGTPDSISIGEIIAANGLREPDTSASQKKFNTAFILVVKNGEVPKGEEIARIETIRKEFESYYSVSTGGMGTMNTSLFGSNPMEIVTNELRGAALGYPYSQPVFAVGGSQPYDWNLTGTLPTGISFDNTTGEFGGTPSQLGNFPVTLTVVDSGLQKDTVSLELVVSDTGESEVVINELELWNRYNVGAGLELYNKGDKAVNLTDWVLKMNGVEGLINYTFPMLVLPPKNYLVLLESSGIDTPSRLFIGQDIDWIYFGSGYCSLINNEGAGIDFVRFGSSSEPPPTGTFWSGTNPTISGAYHNLVRDSLSTDTDNAADFAEYNGSLWRNNLRPSVLCAAIPGDANTSSTLTLGDIIAAVNYVFNKPGWPVCGSGSNLCWLSGMLCRGDWNASQSVTLADVVQGVNYIFGKPNGPWDPVASGTCCQPAP